MAKEKPRYDWETMSKLFFKEAPKIWEHITLLGETHGDNVLAYGYYLTNFGIENFPPRMIVFAKLDLPESDVTNHTALTQHIQGIVDGLSSEALKIVLTVQENYPMLDVLEKDPVFGKDPTIPPSIWYQFVPDREQYRISS